MESQLIKAIENGIMTSSWIEKRLEKPLHFVLYYRSFEKVNDDVICFGYRQNIVVFSAANFFSLTRFVFRDIQQFVEQ